MRARDNLNRSIVRLAVYFSPTWYENCISGMDGNANQTNMRPNASLFPKQLHGAWRVNRAV
jgi:hypothetical protein